ncbi:serine/threonine protein kinase [Streptomyces sp. BHT-5-2]|uniref:serine/threonine-protein kinase n=1 Tax=Streptomyces sp. BHT-5-2 TaxID=2866715 RepID=UPI001C8D263A|nr:serine/threonine-protein kinase [Streptomyces sp. BHT-5-2]QZL03486.1 serine/threonine protein kinase [Streptomyces sp. BHT-5-2]
MGIFGGEGRLIGERYRLGIRLGRGGMGTVWRATDELLGRQVAVKELNLDDVAAEPEARVQRDRAIREARTVAQVKHPNVIVVHDVVEQDGRPWIVMELVEGPSLADRLASAGPLAPVEAARIGRALLGALRAAHARDVLHRDIKPANVLLEDGSDRVVLTDFGIAQVPGATTLTGAAGFVGSPEYTAPERMAGRGAGPEADLWSLGVLLCAALSGVTPFRRDSMAGVLHAVVYEDIELPSADGPLAEAIRGLLERDPRRRLDLDATERLLSGVPAPARDPFAERGAGARPDARPPHTDPFRPLGAAGRRAPAAPVAPLAGAMPAGPAPAPGAAPSAGVAPAYVEHAAPPGHRAATPGTPGTPVPSATRPQDHRRSLVLVAAAAVVGIGGAAAGLAAFLANGGGGHATDDLTAAHTGTSAQATAHKGKKGRQGPPGPTGTPDPAGSSGPRGIAPGDLGPTITVTASAGRDAAAPAPPGYQTVRDPAGFTMAVPTGFTRSYENSRVYYYSEGKRFRIGVQLQKPVPEGPIGAMRTADANGPKNYPGYRDGTVVETTHNGLRAGRWQFVWDGSAQDAGARYTYDLSWNEGGRMMDVWISSPVASRADAKRQFDTAIDSFQLAGH